MSHLRIRITTRTTTTLLNVISTTTTSSANGVCLIMSLTERRSTLSLQPCKQLLHKLHKHSSQSQIQFNIKQINYLPCFNSEYSNTMAKPEESCSRTDSDQSRLDYQYFLITTCSISVNLYHLNKIKKKKKKKKRIEVIENELQKMR